MIWISPLWCRNWKAGLAYRISLSSGKQGQRKLWRSWQIISRMQVPCAVLQFKSINMIFGWVKESDTGKLNLVWGPLEWLLEMELRQRATMAAASWRMLSIISSQDLNALLGWERDYSHLLVWIFIYLDLWNRRF